MYLLVCAVCFAVTSVRETFNTFAVTYLEVRGGVGRGRRGVRALVRHCGRWCSVPRCRWVRV